MKKCFKKFLAVLLAAAMVFGIAPLSGMVGIILSGCLSIKASAAAYQVGEFVEFGSYPQSRVTDTETLEGLNKSFFNWISYGYYSGTGNWADGKMTSKDYMKYADVFYKGTKYRAVKFSEYRPGQTGGLTDADSSSQDNNGYYTDTVYWFKYEPITWRVLDPDQGFIMAEILIDAQPFQNTVYYDGRSGYYKSESDKTSPSDYETSSINSWLNGSFFNTAFSATEIDKSGLKKGDVFLISADEARNKDYGFTSQRYDQKLQTKLSDYAVCQGMSPSSNGYASWMFRSKGQAACHVTHVNEHGYIYGFVNVNNLYGVRPAIKIDLELAEPGGEWSLGYSQIHVVDNYQNKNRIYQKSYFDGCAVALDGIDSDADLCVPGLSKEDNMVPQGITYYPQKDWVLISAYSKKNDIASSIFALDKSSGKFVAQFDLYTEDNKIFSKKPGGIAVSSNNLYISNEQSISYIPLSEFDVKRGTQNNVKIKDTKSLSGLFGEANVSYVSFSDGILYTGNFYSTKDSKYKKAVTDTINSMVFGYKLTGADSDTEWNNFSGIDKIDNPDYKYTIPNEIKEIQCAVVKDGYLYLSSSFGRKNESTLYIVKVDNKTNFSFETEDYCCLAPPMMEGITFIGNNLYAVFESGAYFYRAKNMFNKAKNPTDVVWMVDIQAVMEEEKNGFEDGDCEKYDVKYKNGKVSLSFKQSWFKNDSLQYKHELAQLCSKFVTLGYETDSLKEGLKALGFNTDSVFWETKAEKDKVDNFIADRKITVNSETYTLLFVGCIGTNTVQWYSNFEPGTGEIHASFNDAKNYVYQNIGNYMSEQGIDPTKTKILLCGHSRGAATANLVAAKLIDEEIYATKGNIYTYTFATPNPTSSENRFNEKYNRIYNFVNPEDFVTKVLPSQWGYGRYGVTYALPSKTNTAAYKGLKANMQDEYNVIMNNQKYHPYPKGEAETYNIVNDLTSVVENIDQLDDKKFTWLGELVSVQEFFMKTLCKFMANNEEKTDDEKAQKKEAAQLLFDTWLSKRFQSDDTIRSLADYFVVYQGLGGFTSGIIKDDYFNEAHQPETYCAYMMSMTATQATTVREGYKNSVNCPVDIEVYDKTTGELVGRIIDNVVDEEIATKENSIVMNVDGDSKSFWLPSDGEYDVRLTGNDNGIMDYTVTSIDSVDAIEVQRANFVEVDIVDGNSMEGKFIGEEFALEEYAIEESNGNQINSDNVFSSKDADQYKCRINVSVEGNGFVSGEGTYIKGDYITLSVIEELSSDFVGWYETGKLVSSDSEYSFVAKGNRNLTAKFSESPASFNKVKLRTPSTTVISYADSIILHADYDEELPEGYSIKWEASNSNFIMYVSDDDRSCKITSFLKGDTTFTVTICDAEGNVVSTDEQTMTSKAGFFDKIIAFFKKIFGLTKIIMQSYEEVS